jgi:hypothetical protein
MTGAATRGITKSDGFLFEKPLSLSWISLRWGARSQKE